MNNDRPNPILQSALVLLLCAVLSVVYTACGNDSQTIGQIKPNALTIAVIDGDGENIHFPSPTARRRVFDGMRQAADDLNVDLIVQSETGFDTVQFFFDSLSSIEIDGIIYAQPYNQQAVDGIDRATNALLPIVTIDIEPENVNIMEPLVNIGASPSITALQVLSYTQSQQLQHGLCVLNPAHIEAVKFNALCSALQSTTRDDIVTFDTIEIANILQEDLAAINYAIDQNDTIDTLLFDSTGSAQRYIQRIPSTRRSAFLVGALSSESFTQQELEGRGIDFIIYEDYFAKGYHAVLHLSLYIISGQIAGTGLRHIESGSHIIAQ